MNDDTWHMVRETPRVTGFVGSGQRPSPLTPDEVDRIVHKVEVAAEHPKPRLKYDKGENVKITDGPSRTLTAWWTRSTTSAPRCG